MDTPNNSNDRKADFLTRVWWKLAGIDEETMLKCPERDWDAGRDLGKIMAFMFSYVSALFAIISNRLFAPAGTIRPELILASIFLASFLVQVDRYMVYRSGWALAGIEALRRGGLDVSGGPAARIKVGIFLAVRILLSIGMAQLTAIFLSLLVFSDDINARNQGQFIRANAHLVATATSLVDADIQRSTDAVSAQTEHVAALTKQVSAVRQNEIDSAGSDPQVQQAQQEVTRLLDQKAKADEELRDAENFASNELAGIRGAAGNSGIAGAGPKRKAALENIEHAKARVAQAASALEDGRGRLESARQKYASAAETVKQHSHDQLPAFEEALHAEQDKLQSLKDGLAELTNGRNDAIRKAVESAPDYVARNDGFLAQISALERIAKEDDKIAAVIVLIDIVSFGFELAAVLAKVTSFVPTEYATMLARDAYLHAVRTVDEMMTEMNGGPKVAANDAGAGQPKPANDNYPSHTDGMGEQDEDDPPPPPKRKRGRPRKGTFH